MREDIEFQVVWADVSRALAEGQQPAVIIERPRSHDLPAAWAGPSEVAREGLFYVPLGDVFSPGVRWSLTTLGTHVRVPLCAYRTASCALANIWGLGIQLGFLAGQRLHEHEPRAVARGLVLVFGKTCDDLRSGPEAADAFRCYAGVAIRC